MTTPKRLSVVASTFNRAALLDRALATYSKQTLPASDWEYLIADDGSTDDTREVVARWAARGVPVRLLDAGTDLGRPKAPGQWRDGSGVRNSLTEFAVGEYLISTHPEILLPSYALEAMLEALRTATGRAWVTGIPYWLPPVDDTVWQGWTGSDRELRALRDLPGFYDPNWPDKAAPGSVDYRNQNQESRMDWESEVFWGMSMATWRWMGGFREFEKWGAVDMDFWNRRVVAGVKSFLAKWGDSPHKERVIMVYHQHHDSPRVLEDAMAEIRSGIGGSYRSASHVRETGGLHVSYHHGHRERAAVEGTTQGIMQDHLNRYQFAAKFVGEQDRVVDMPCGTGYGATFLAPPSRQYFGVDIDAESVNVAAGYLTRRGDNVIVGSLHKIPLPKMTADVLVSFEGLEHVDEQDRVVREFARVLKPGGWLILSTPQKGATPGTPFDKHMLTMVDLAALFYYDDGRDWFIENAEWYHQKRYGMSDVEEGRPTADAEIQILRVQRR